MPHLDFTQPPFDVLRLAERQSLKKHTQIRYLAANEALSDEDLKHFFVVLKGQVEQTLDGEFVGSYLGNKSAPEQLNNNDWFDSRRTPDQQDNNDTHAKSYQYRATEDTLLLQIAGEAIDKISAQNHLVRQLLSDNLPERLKALQQRRSQQNPTLALNKDSYHEQQEVQQIMLQPVISIRLLPVRVINADSSLYHAATTMIEAGLKHVLIRPANHQQTPEADGPESSNSEQGVIYRSDHDLGMLSDADICRAVSQQQDPASTPCQDFANFNLRTIKASDEIGEALMIMTRYRIHRLPVIDDDGQVVGVLALRDLLAYLGQHSQLISIQIDQATDMTSLDTAVELIGRYIRAQHHNGVKIGIVSRMVQTLNAQVFTKLWKTIVPEEVLNNTCVIVMGSEGRGEQIMRTDQDNALIIRDGYSHPDLAVFADTFNTQLATLGYPLCDGDIMMNNPMWRQQITPFKKQVSTWFKNTDPMHSIYISAILDAEYVCGDESLLTEVREHLKTAHRQSDPMFVRQFARAALQFGDVNQWWQKLVPLLGGKPSSNDIDLKKAGIFPLVHGIRAMALEYDILQVPSTKDRLKALVQARALTKDRADTLEEALEFFMAQRLSVALSTNDKHARQIDPTTLSALERDLFKECLAVVKSFKNQLSLHYKLEF